YWSVEADLVTPKQETFHAALSAIDGATLDKFAIADQQQADKLFAALKDGQYTVSAVTSSESTKHPLPPFRTSTLQQEANRRLGFSAKLTMRLAQQLYEGVELGRAGHQGLITYMRTDSLNLSENFLAEAGQFIVKEYGAKYGLAKPRYFKNTSKGAQEAHEAIRPTEASRTPESVASHLNPQQLKLYRLIWSRAVASQMAPAQVASAAIEVTEAAAKYTFRATGQTITFDGFLKVYPTSTKEVILPVVTKGELVTATAITPEQHFTQPPARYTDASLIKILEEKGIGRPSTYAPTIGTIISRGYVTRDRKALLPTDIAFIVIDLLVEHFPNIVDYAFTATMEGELDAIAAGEVAWRPVIKTFYDAFAANLETKLETVTKVNATAEVTDEVCDKCGQLMVIKIGRFGKFLSCSGWPECKNAKPLDANGDAAPVETVDETCPKCGQPMVMKVGRFGKFIACSNYPTCKTTKQTNASTGVTCPECKAGEIVERRSRRGTFYGCDAYPKCKFTLWAKPTGEKCATCGALMVRAKGDTVQCSNKECATRQ
ncbi:MAG: type I DNA topoisomerase, partial [Patescibacteria group bacterium]